MYDIERQNKILEILAEKKSISVNKLSELLYASGATIRRDLAKMERKGLVVRTFGAVMINARTTNKETSFEFREKTNIIEKRTLCQKAVEFLKDNSTLFIDSSTTLLHIVPYLNNFTNLTIITNGLFIANEIINQTKHHVIVVGGTIQPNTNSILGPLAHLCLSRFHADVVLMSCGALDFSFGLSESSVDAAEFKQCMIENADRVIVLCDESKFHHRALFQTCQIDKIDVLISEKKYTEEEKKLLAQNHITCAI